MNNKTIITTYSGKVTTLVNDSNFTAKSLAGKAIHKDCVRSIKVVAGNHRTMFMIDKDGNKSDWIIPKRTKRKCKR